LFVSLSSSSDPTRFNAHRSHPPASLKLKRFLHFPNLLFTLDRSRRHATAFTATRHFKASLSFACTRCSQKISSSAALPLNRRRRRRRSSSLSSLCWLKIEKNASLMHSDSISSSSSSSKIFANVVSLGLERELYDASVLSSSSLSVPARDPHARRRRRREKRRPIDDRDEYRRRCIERMTRKKNAEALLQKKTQKHKKREERCPRLRVETFTREEEMRT